MRRDYLVYIEDILDAMEKAELILKKDIPRIKSQIQQILANYEAGTETVEGK